MVMETLACSIFPTPLVRGNVGALSERVTVNLQLSWSFNWNCRSPNTDKNPHSSGAALMKTVLGNGLVSDFPLGTAVFNHWNVSSLVH